MADSEHPPVPHAERNNPKPAESTPAPAVTAKQRLEKLIAKFKKLEELQAEFKKDGSIKEEPTLRKTWAMRDELRLIVAEIKNGKPSPDSIKLPAIALSIIKDIDVSRIQGASAPVVYELLRISQPDSAINLNTPEGLTLALEAMLNVSQFEPHMATEIIGKLYKDALAKGCDITDETLIKADRFIDPKKYRRQKEELRENQKERKNKVDEILAPAAQITLTDVARERVRETFKVTFKTQLDNGQLSVPEFEKMVDAEVNRQTDAVRGAVTTALNDVISTYGQQPREGEALTKYRSLLYGMKAEQKISQEQLDMLLGLPDNPEMRRMVESQYKGLEGSQLIHEALRIISPDELQLNLLKAISSPTALKDFLETTKNSDAIQGLRYMTIEKGEQVVNWDVFYKDVKGLFGELISIADRNPNQFFEQAFNPMYEGHLYQMLLQRFTQLGSQISSTIKEGEEEGKWFGKQEFKISEVTAVPSGKTDKAPYKQEMYTSTQSYSFDKMVGSYLTNRMNEFKHVREHLHNINAICTQGLGWEQLKQYAERLELGKLDSLVREEDGLSLASNFYSEALQQEVAANGKIVQPNFGRTDDMYQLNSVERTAFFQMKAHLKTHGYEDLSTDALDTLAIQKVRMAAAISYGLTGEFWNTMLTARMPIGSGKTVNAAGETVNETTLPFTGTDLRGYEKMIGELDLDMVLQRFNLPAMHIALRYVPRYRDMQHPPGVWDKNGYIEHGQAYEAKSLIEDAVVNGRSDRLAELDETYVYFLDYMRTKCVGLFARGGWRFTNWETCQAYKDPQTRKQVDYVQTLDNVRRMGSYITKRFIDELSPAKITGMTREEVYAITGVDKPGSQLTEAEIEHWVGKESGKKALYDRLLFTQMSRVTPTKFLQLEDRRWTPRGEKLLRDHLQDHLKAKLGAKYPHTGILNSKVYDMYVSALTLAEKSIWAEKRPMDPNYQFESLDIDHCKNELLVFFKGYKDKVGKIQLGGEAVQIVETDEEFIDNLKDFQKTLRTAINLPRHQRENNTGPSETLQKRFANMLSSTDGDSKGNIENLISGGDFDLENFRFSGGGGYAATRMFGETEGIAKKMNPALSKLIFEALPDLTKGQYKDIHEFEKAIKEKLVPIFKDVHGAIANMDKEQADKYCLSLALFVSNMIGKDRILRIKGIGGAIDWWKRQRYGTQASIYQDFFPNNVHRPTHSLDSDEIYAMGHIIMNAINIASDERKPDHMETVLSIAGRPVMTRMVYKGEKMVDAKFLGIPYKKKVIDENSINAWSQEVFEKGTGLTGAIKYIETHIPIFGATLVLLLMAMAYMANEKNKKK